MASQFILFLLIPLYSLENHFGGQATFVPNPRLIFRGIIMPLTFVFMAYLLHFSLDLLAKIGIASFTGMALWWVPAWSQGFMALPYEAGVLPADRRRTGLLDNLCNFIMGLTPQTVLSLRQCRIWGILYMTLRGGYLYPLFAFLGGFYNPWACVIGLGCFLQGAVYGLAKEVLYAEFIMGAIIGAMLAGVLMI